MARPHFSGDPWDLAAQAVIVEEAGGCLTDLLGGRRLDTRTVFSTNGALHPAPLDLLIAGDETAHLTTPSQDDREPNANPSTQ